MPHDIQNLLHWLHICLTIAAICSTLFPILYAFSPWYASIIGRVLMLQSVAFAAAIDFTWLVQYWRPFGILTMFWVEAVIFTLISATSLALTLIMVRANYFRYRRKIKRRQNVGSSSGSNRS